LQVPNNKTAFQLFHIVSGINTMSVASTGFDLILDLRGRFSLTERRPEASSYIMRFETGRSHRGRYTDNPQSNTLITDR